MSDEILLELYGPADQTAEEKDAGALALRGELLGLEEVATVGPASLGPAPPGARAVDVAGLGALLVAAEPTVAVLTKVIGVVRDWLKRGRGGGTLRVTVNGQSLELTPTTAQQDELVRAFIDRAGAPA